MFYKYSSINLISPSNCSNYHFSGNNLRIYYLDKNAKLDSKVGIALSPSHVMPNLTKFDIKKYNASEKYDYIIVNYYNILREGFDDSNIREKYNPVYFVNADGAILVTVYKR